MFRHCRHPPPPDGQLEENIWETLKPQVNLSKTHLVIVFDKDIWINIWKNILRALNEPQVILFQKHWTFHLDILIVFRKENKGPYVPNRDIMKLFTNTPEAR